MAQPDPVPVELVGEPSALADPTVWVPAVVALLVVALGGLLQWQLQRWRLAAEERRWTSEMNALEERWKHEQAESRRNLLNDQRRDVYLRFLAGFRSAERSAASLSTSIRVNVSPDRRRELVEDVRRSSDELATALDDLQLVASEAVGEAALLATVEIDFVTSEMAYISSDDPEVWREWDTRKTEVRKRRDVVLERVRAELVGDE
jgi:hypothetical protein